MIIAGTSNNIYYSTNNGVSWTVSNLTGKFVASLVVNGSTIFAGTTSYGVYVSSTGTSWTSTMLNNQSAWSLAASGNNIFAGTYNNGIFESTNNGVNWAQTSLIGQTVMAISTIGTNTFAGLMIYGVYLSSNNGANWNQTAMNNGSIGSFAVSGNNIFTGVDAYGVYLSTNQGTNWTAKNQGFFANTTCNALLVLNNYIFAGTSDGYSVWRRGLSEILTEIKNINTESPSAFSLSQNYPNPFNPTTNIKFGVVKSGNVKIVVYDATGREVQTLVNESMKPGAYEATFDGASLNSGVYFYKLMSDGFTETKKMLMIK
jgi:hypothetical protein